MSLHVTTLNAGSQESPAAQSLGSSAAPAGILPFRLQGLDFAKGALVICMVIYHSLNYSSHLELGFKYLAFLPPSFILVTGFLMARVYFTRPATQDRTTSERLFARGLKLLVLFSVLNIAAGFVSRRNYNGQTLGLEIFFDHLFEVYVLGDGRWAVFDVLLPIAYLLLFGPLFLLIERRLRWLLPLLTIVAIIAFDYLERTERSFATGALLTAGMVGLVIGRRSTLSDNGIVRYWPISAAIYAACWASRVALGDNYAMRLVAAIAALALFFGIGTVMPPQLWLSKRIVRLGVYSLVAYIGQIAVLQILSRWLHRPDPGSLAYLGLFAGTLLITTLAIELLYLARSASKVVDNIYRFVLA